MASVACFRLKTKLFACFFLNFYTGGFVLFVIFFFAPALLTLRIKFIFDTFDVIRLF